MRRQRSRRQRSRRQTARFLRPSKHPRGGVWIKRHRERRLRVTKRPRSPPPLTDSSLPSRGSQYTTPDDSRFSIDDSRLAIDPPWAKGFLKKWRHCFSSADSSRPLVSRWGMNRLGEFPSSARSSRPAHAAGHRSRARSRSSLFNAVRASRSRWNARARRGETGGKRATVGDRAPFLGSSVFVERGRRARGGRGEDGERMRA